MTENALAKDAYGRPPDLLTKFFAFIMEFLKILGAFWGRKLMKFFQLFSEEKKEEKIINYEGKKYGKKINFLSLKCTTKRENLCVEENQCVEENL